MALPLAPGIFFDGVRGLYADGKEALERQPFLRSQANDVDSRNSPSYAFEDFAVVFL